MDRPTAIPRAVAFPAPDIEVHSFTGHWHLLLPLWRHAVWGVLFFVLLALSVSVRLDVTGLHKDLARTDRLQRDAVVLNERLTLERAVRRRGASLSQVATTMGLSGDVTLVRVEARP